MSILLKYSLWLGSVLLAVSGAIISAALWFQYHSMTSEALLRGHAIAKNMAAPAADALLRKNDLQLVTLALDSTRGNPQVVYAAILDSKGRVRGHPEPKALGKPLSFTAEARLEGAPEGAEVRVGTTGKVPVWDIRAPILLKGTSTVLGQAHVGLAREGVAEATRASLWRLALISLLLLAVGVGGLALAVRVAVRPLRELSTASLRVGQGRFDTRVAVRSQDELGQLASTFNEMVEGLQKAEKARGEHQRIESELELARGIQASLLPEVPPQIAGLEVAFRCEPAKELGGDFYDCIPLDDGKGWGFLIADVSGKGVPAALNVVNLRNIFRVVAPGQASPAETVKRVNALAFPDLKGENFVTLIYAVADGEGGMRLVNAGHDPAYWIKADGSLESFEGGALPVGLTEAEEYDRDVEERSFRPGPGDRLLLYTDGVTEAMDADSRQFGLDALKECACEDGSASETVLRVADAVANHLRGQPPSDDVTLLALRWKV